MPTETTLEALIQDPKNARRRTQRSTAMIERSLQEFGAARSLVIDEAGMILAGNGTAEAAAAIGIEKVLVVPADGRTLIVAETLALRLTAFDVANDGTLSNRRVWADLSEQFGAPDGICLDAEGAVWIAAATTPRAMRIAEGG
jgi:sugar lactone lactonase YvrE